MENVKQQCMSLAESIEMMFHSIDLAECPFCGTKPGMTCVMSYSKDGSGVDVVNGKFRAECECQNKKGVSFTTPKDAADNWNRSVYITTRIMARVHNEKKR